MFKDMIKKICDYMVKHCAKVFPVIVVLVVAVTVSVALGANRAKGQEPNLVSAQNTATPESGSAPENTPEVEIAPTMAPEEVPLTENTDEDIYQLVVTYYNSMAIGDVETLQAIHDSLSVEEILRFEETSKFMDHYTEFEVYVKQGLEADSVLACVYYKTIFLNYPVEFPGYQMLYICRDEQGKPYVKSEQNFTDEEIEYIQKVIAQDDVIEFATRIDVDYKEILASEENQLYLAELGRQIDQAVGKALENLGVSMAQENVGGDAETDKEGAEGDGEGQEGNAEEPPVSTQEPVVNSPQYAVATTTVNVRSSDSEMADKIGKVAGGDRVRVQEVRVNGWTKVLYEGADGYIKSEYLQLEESTPEQTVIGKVTATTNINVRSSADTSGARLGLLAAGESLDLLGEEGEWYKVNYNGHVAYVKAEFVTKN